MIKPTFEDTNKVLDKIIVEESLRLIKQKIEEGLGHKLPENIALCFSNDGKILFIPNSKCDIWELRRLQAELMEKVTTLEKLPIEESKAKCSGIWIS